MKQDKEQTKVIFRKFYPEEGGDVIAIFPELAGTFNPLITCLSYQHIGQHGSIFIPYDFFTFPATEEEYAPLKQELESLGYNLRVCKRMSRKDLQSRLEQV